MQRGARQARRATVRHVYQSNEPCLGRARECLSCFVQPATEPSWAHAERGQAGQTRATVERLVSERRTLAEQAQQLAPAQARLQLMTALLQAEPPAGRLPRLQRAPGRQASVAAAAEGRSQAAEVKLAANFQGSQINCVAHAGRHLVPSCCWLLSGRSQAAEVRL